MRELFSSNGACYKTFYLIYNENNIMDVMKILVYHRDRKALHQIKGGICVFLL